MKKSILQAIKKFCFECSGKSNKELANCSAIKCPLHIYRNGKDPNKAKKNLTDEQRNLLAEHMKAVRKNSKK